MMACATISISLVSSPSISITLPRKKGGCQVMHVQCMGNQCNTKRKPGTGQCWIANSWLLPTPPRQSQRLKKIGHCGQTHWFEMVWLWLCACMSESCLPWGAGNVGPKHVRVQSFTKTSLDCIHTDTLRFLKTCSGYIAGTSAQAKWSEVKPVCPQAAREGHRWKQNRYVHINALQMVLFMIRRKRIRTVASDLPTGSHPLPRPSSCPIVDTCKSSVT